jgi:hypothetical protein
VGDRGVDPLDLPLSIKRAAALSSEASRAP